MENDDYRSLVEFEENYWKLIERCYIAWQSKPCVENITSTAYPQGSQPHSAEHFLAKFEAMEKSFLDEFKPAATTDGSGSQPAQVDVIFVRNQPKKLNTNNTI